MTVDFGPPDLSSMRQIGELPNAKAEIDTIRRFQPYRPCFAFSSAFRETLMIPGIGLKEAVQVHVDENLP